MRKKVLQLITGLFAFSILSFVFTACGPNLPRATGDDDEIFVVADSAQYEELEGTFLQVFSKIIYTPQPEKLFELTRIDLKDLNKYKSRKNLIIMASLNSEDPTSDYVRSMLDSTVASLVEQDSIFVMNKHDLWAKSQLVMVLASSSLEKLKNKMLSDHENLLYYFRSISNKRLSQSLYNERYEQRAIEAQLLNDYGWMIFVQIDYLLALNKPQDNFVWLRRSPDTGLERWIFVHWIDNATPEFLNPDSIAAERDKITEMYYRTSDNKSHVMIADNYMTTTEENFNGKYALMTQGLWRMSDKSMGGPFVNYTFYDENTQRIYMLDGSIFAPKFYKKKLIQQLDVMLKSFLTKEELTEERIEDLMDELE